MQRSATQAAQFTLNASCSRTVRLAIDTLLVRNNCRLTVVSARKYSVGFRVFRVLG